jgi:NADH dehydrogenase FAD-containing subunit
VDSHIFTPLLHEVATGGLAHHQVVESIRQITYKKGANVLVAEVKNINTAHKIVETETSSVPYDYLVIATGAVTDFYSIPGDQKIFVPIQHKQQFAELLFLGSVILETMLWHQFGWIKFSHHNHESFEMP